MLSGRSSPRFARHQRPLQSSLELHTPGAVQCIRRCSQGGWARSAVCRALDNLRDRVGTHPVAQTPQTPNLSCVATLVTGCGVDVDFSSKINMVFMMGKDSPTRRKSKQATKSRPQLAAEMARYLTRGLCFMEAVVQCQGIWAPLMS